MPISEAYQRVLDQAIERERRILSMRDDLGLTFEAIGAAMDMDRGQAYYLYRRGKKRATEAEAKNGKAG